MQPPVSAHVLRGAWHAICTVWISMVCCAASLASVDADRCEGSCKASSGGRASLLQVSSRMEDVNQKQEQTPEIPVTNSLAAMPTVATESLEYEAQPELGQASAVQWWSRGLHSIVGQDGVLMISLPRSERFNGTKAKLEKVGIHPTFFEGTDGYDVSVLQSTLDDTLKFTLVKDGMEGTKEARAFQALAVSHRQALQFAATRQQDWTAILEDDAVPIWGPNLAPHDSWIQEFESAWAVIPPQARLVRLGYCMLVGDKTSIPSRVGMEVRTFASQGAFRVTSYTGNRGVYESGGCTTAYIVHKELVPELLSLFPCECTLDCCWNLHFNRKTASGNPRGLDVLFNIETHVTPDESFYNAAQSPNYLGALQFGVVQQDWDGYDFSTGTTSQYYQSKSLLDANKPQVLSQLSQGKLVSVVPKADLGSQVHHY